MWTWINARELSLGIRSVSVLGSDFAVLVQLGLNYKFTVPHNGDFLLGPSGLGRTFTMVNFILSNHEVRMSCPIIFLSTMTA